MLSVQRCCQKKKKKKERNKKLKLSSFKTQDIKVTKVCRETCNSQIYFPCFSYIYIVDATVNFQQHYRSSAVSLSFGHTRCWISGLMALKKNSARVSNQDLLHDRSAD